MTMVRLRHLADDIGRKKDHNDLIKYSKNSRKTIYIPTFKRKSSDQETSADKATKKGRSEIGCVGEGKTWTDPEGCQSDNQRV